MIPKVNNSQQSNLRFSWQATGLYSLTSMVAFITAFPGQNISFWRLLVLALTLTATIAMVIHLTDFLIRKIFPAKLSGGTPLFLLLVMAIGFIRGLAFFTLVDLAGIAQPTPLPFRLLTSTITTLIWLTFSCALIEATTNYSRQFSNLFNETAMALALASKPGQDRGIDSLDNLVALKRNLSGILEKASAQGVSADALLTAGAEVRGQIEQQLKPLSHRLWFNERRNRPEIRLFGLIGDAVTNFSFSTPRLIIVWASLSFASTINAYAIDRVLFGTALSATFLAGLLYLSRAISSKVPKNLSSFFSVTVIIILSIFPVSLTDILMPLFGFETILFPVHDSTIVYPIAIATFLLVESGITLVERDRRLLNDLFETQLRSAGTGDQSSLASYLHNSLQSELTGIAFRLEAAAANPDSYDSRETLEQLGALINRSISDDFAAFEETPLLRLQRMIEAWDGIAKVSANIADECKADSKRLNLIVQVIEEATTNSVRHGKARTLHAEVSMSGSSALIEISTDATELENPSVGLGSEWMREHALSVTPLRFTASGTVFTVEV
jgi:signal transduction histidine kinase